MSSRAHADRPVPLWLDHASVQVPSLASAVEHLDLRLGLTATVSPAAPHRHSRVHLDRTYLEVAARPGGTGWSASLYFLRFADPDALRTHLEASGVPYTFTEYVGVDGTWDDVALNLGPVPAPILIRRTSPSQVARDWPPALGRPHRSGAWSLAAIHAVVPSLEAALDAYGRLLQLGDAPRRTEDPRSGRPRAELLLAGGRLVLVEGPAGESTSELAGIVLGVSALEATRRALEGRVPPADRDGIAWLDPSETCGLRLGFAEAGSLPIQADITRD